MTSVLEISTLGGLDIRLNGEGIPPLASRKAEALLVYLAQAGRPHFRESLAELLWDDQPLNRSLSNLSVLLTSFRKNLPGYIQADRKYIWFDTQKEYRLDVRLLEQQLDEAKRRKTITTGMDRETASLIESAVAYFKGSFLAGFQLRDGRGFEEWLVIERERIHHLVFEGLGDLVSFYLNIGEYGEGLRFANRLLALDPLREETHCQLMLLLARNGQRQQALEQYETCKQILASEMGLDPSPETISLLHRIRESDHARITLPQQGLPLIGREHELALITSRLADPACRLLTLVGLGGVGKTRLAIEAARLNEQAFLNGVIFIDLEPVDAENMFYSALANGLGFSFFGRNSPLEQLIHFLEGKELLLILDNFENLIAHAYLLDEILKKAEHVKCLVTSRERLNLRAEWLLELQGLSVSTTSEAVSRPYLASALTLFERHAKRVQVNFTVDETNLPDVAYVCQLVGGFPLGIELAASWIRYLSPKEIAQEIINSIDFLESTLRDIPERHRSMRAVMDHTWRQLTGREQNIFKRLSVFRGEFNREAAWEVAQASLHILVSLADKSLLQTKDGRYRFHELTRQYAAFQLREKPADAQETLFRFGNYFSQFLQRHASQLRGGKKQRETVLLINDEINNIREAWHVAITLEDVPFLELALDPLASFLEMRSWYQEGLEMVSELIKFLKEKKESTSNPSSIFIRALSWQGYFYTQLGQYAEAETCYTQCQTLTMHPDQAGVLHAEALGGLGRLALNRGEHEQALEFFQKALSIFEDYQHLPGKAEMLVSIGDYARERGDFQSALVYSEAALKLYRELQDEWRQSKSLSTVGNVYGSLGEYTQARFCFEQAMEICKGIDDQYGIARNAHNLSNILYFENDFHGALELRKMVLEICREIGFEWGIASSLQHVGAVEKRLGNYLDAARYYRESYQRFESLGDRRSCASVLHFLGNLMNEQRNFDKAIKYYLQSLSLALEIKAAPLILAIFIGLADLLKVQPLPPVFAYTIYRYVHQHPGTEHQTREAIPGKIENLTVNLPPDQIDVAEKQAQTWLNTEDYDLPVKEITEELRRVFVSF